MISLCPSCWRTVSPDERTCPNCGADIGQLDRRRYTEKLIGALRHPDPETVGRVAQVLARTAPDEAYRPLENALWHYWRAPYVAAAIVEALGWLDLSEARSIIKDALGHESVIVRAAAAKVLQGRRPNGRPS